MIAIITSDGNGNDTIIGIVSDRNFVSKFVQEHTGFTDIGFVKYNTKEYQEYYCISFKEKPGIILTI